MVTPSSFSSLSIAATLSAVAGSRLPVGSSARITQDFFDRKSADWRNEMAQIMRNVEAHQKARESCMDEGIRIFELVDRAWMLYEKQEMLEKRRLLDYVFSNSTWAHGILAPTYRKPFDLIVEAQELQDKRGDEDGGGFDKTAQNEIWLPDKGSNLGPTDPESVALPTELSGSDIIAYPARHEMSSGPGTLAHDQAPFPIAFSILAHVSRSVTVRLNTSFPGAESVSTQKYPCRSN